MQLVLALQQYCVAKVISSPYLRCLETARQICQALHPPIQEVEIDNSLGEVMQPECVEWSLSCHTFQIDNNFKHVAHLHYHCLLLLAQVAAGPYLAGNGPKEGQTLEEWMWCGKAPEQGWGVGLGVTCVLTRTLPCPSLVELVSTHSCEKLMNVTPPEAVLAYTGSLKGTDAGCPFPEPDESMGRARQRYTHAIQVRIM